jgi:hypothetical protein
MLGYLVLFSAAIAMSWIYGLEKEGMQLRKDSFISKSTCHITLYSTLIHSYRLVTHIRAAAYTKNNILSAFEATGIWPRNPHRVFLRQSRNITRFESPPATPTPFLSATRRQPRAVSRLARSALHLVTHQSPSSLKLKAPIVQLGRSAQGALADKELEDEMLRTLRSGAKDPTAVAAKDRRHLCKAHVYTAEDVVQLREERERLDREKVAKAKMRQEKAAEKVVSSGAGSKSSKHAEKKIIGAKKAPVIVLNDCEDEEEDMVGRKGWDEEENGGEEDSVVYIGDMLDLEDAMEHGKGREGVSSQPPVVTRSGRVVKTGHLSQ